MYNEGIGVKRNKKEALNWATKAYDQGYEDAYDLIKGITRK
jgi:TPR repeat protein